MIVVRSEQNIDLFSLQLPPSVCSLNGQPNGLPNHPAPNHGTNTTTTAFDGTEWIYTLSAVCPNVSHSCCSTTHVANLGRRTMPSASPPGAAANTTGRIVWHGRWPNGGNINGTFICAPFNNIRRNHSPKVGHFREYYFDYNQHYIITPTV